MKELLINLKLITHHAFWLKDYSIVFVVNPLAGGFKNTKICANYSAQSKDFLNHLTSLQPEAYTQPVTFFYTSHIGSFKEAFSQNQLPRSGSLLYVVLGGDGLASEVIAALNHQNVEPSPLVLIMPFGTGNDGGSSRNFLKTLEMLYRGTGKRVKAHIITTKLANQQSYEAYNVVSIGIDAFIAHATNLLKAKFAGNFYKLMVDFAALCYPLFYKKGTMTMKAQLGHNKVFELHKPLIFLCIGNRGGAQYGGGKCVIPDEENICALEYINTWQRILYKNKIAQGRHRNLKQTHLFTSTEISCAYDNEILLNIDGEIYPLTPEAFPINFTITVSSVVLLKEELA